MSETDTREQVNIRLTPAQAGWLDAQARRLGSGGRATIVRVMIDAAMRAEMEAAEVQR